MTPRCDVGRACGWSPRDRQDASDAVTAVRAGRAQVVQTIHRRREKRTAQMTVFAVPPSHSAPGEVVPGATGRVAPEGTRCRSIGRAGPCVAAVFPRAARMAGRSDRRRLVLPGQLGVREVERGAGPGEGAEL